MLKSSFVEFLIGVRISQQLPYRIVGHVCLNRFFGRYMAIFHALRLYKLVIIYISHPECRVVQIPLRADLSGTPIMRFGHDDAGFASGITIDDKSGNPHLFNDSRKKQSELTADTFTGEQCILQFLRFAINFITGSKGGIDIVAQVRSNPGIHGLHLTFLFVIMTVYIQRKRVDRIGIFFRNLSGSKGGHCSGRYRPAIYYTCRDAQ